MDREKFANKPNSGQASWEIRLGYLLPILFVMGAMVSFAMTQPNWDFEGFVQLALHAEGQADYLPDAVNLKFAPVNPEIVEDFDGNQLELPASLDGNNFAATPDPNLVTATAQPTSLIINSETPPTLPTLPSLPSPTLPLPTLPLPTSPLPTLPLPTSALPTVELPIPTIPIVSDAVSTLVPTAIPCLLLVGCL